MSAVFRYPGLVIVVPVYNEAHFLPLPVANPGVIAP